MKEINLANNFGKVNILKNRYVTDGNIQIFDETIFNLDTMLFLVIYLMIVKKLEGFCYIELKIQIDPKSL